jgi:putative salt-induced outer membrane protein YdiY
LIGLGPRFKLSQNKNFRYYLGTLLMYEHEEVNDPLTKILRDFRGSTYFSCSLYTIENLSIVSTTYYQPLLKQFSDFRISNETSIAFRILNNLAFKTTFIYNFDAEPIVNIPRTQYELTNGLIYSFD